MIRNCFPRLRQHIHLQSSYHKLAANQPHDKSNVDFRFSDKSLELLVKKYNSSETTILKFNPHWLRFNCHSKQSKQPGSGQRIIDIDKISPNLSIANVTKANSADELIIKWNNGDSSQLPLEFLLRNHPNMRDNDGPKYKTATDLKSFDYRHFWTRSNQRNNSAIFDWLKHLAEYGVCLVRNVPTQNGMVKRVAELIAPVQNTIYGEEFDVKSEEKPINIAYSNEYLGFHMDLIYYESAPGLQFLHCLKFDEVVTGGESLFLDVFHVCEEFRQQHPTEFTHLTHIPATFQKVHTQRSRPVCMVYRKPHIMLNKQEQIIAVNWAPPFEGPLTNLTNQEIEDYYKSYLLFSRFMNNHPKTIVYRLKPGELVVFNNRRILHGRKQFESNNGVRHLQGCYVNIDEFKSEALVREYGEMVEKGLIDKNSDIQPTSLSLFKTNVGNQHF